MHLALRTLKPGYPLGFHLQIAQVHRQSTAPLATPRGCSAPPRWALGSPLWAQPPSFHTASRPPLRPISHQGLPTRSRLGNLSSSFHCYHGPTQALIPHLTRSTHNPFTGSCDRQWTTKDGSLPPPHRFRTPQGPGLPFFSVLDPSPGTQGSFPTLAFQDLKTGRVPNTSSTP